MAFSRRQFFAPLNRGTISTSISCPPPSLSLAALKSHLCASYEPTPLLPILHFRIYIYLYGSSIETSISRRCLPFTNNSKVPLSSIDPQPCRLLSRPSSLGSSFFPFLVPSLSLSLSLSTEALDTERERWNPQIGKWERPHLRECEGGGRRSVSHICESQESQEYVVS